MVRMPYPISIAYGLGKGGFVVKAISSDTLFMCNRRVAPNEDIVDCKGSIKPQGYY